MPGAIDAADDLVLEHARDVVGLGRRAGRARVESVRLTSSIAFLDPKRAMIGPCTPIIVSSRIQKHRIWIRKERSMSRPPLDRPYTDDDVERLRGSVRVEHTLARLGAERLRTLLAERDVGAGARRDDRRPGGADGEGRAEGDLPLRLAGRGRREPRGRHLSRPEPLPRELGPGARATHQQRAAARRPDRARGGRRRRRTGWRRSSPTPRPASAARSTRSRS